MPRALFEKTGKAIYISHLDLMRVFQRAFKRAGLPLTHTQGYNPRPSVSIALPLSLGVESQCELLDFDLEGALPPWEEITHRLNACLTEGIRVRQIYPDGQKLKHLALLQSILVFEYDHSVPGNAQAALDALFSQEEVLVEKKNKNGISEQNIAAMIRRLDIVQLNENELQLDLLACCQNPTLNPMQLEAAVRKYLPDLAPDFVRCRREEIYDTNETIFR